MPLNDILFVKGQGGLGRPLPGQDFISSLLFYSASLPSGFTTTNRIKKFFSPTDADAAGIKLDYADETKATGTVSIASLASPVQSAATTSTGGNLAAATYYYVISALNAVGETLKSNEISIVSGANSANTLNWGAVTGATGYRVYRGTTAAGENVYYSVGNVTTYVDNGAASTAGTPSATNTTGLGTTTQSAATTAATGGSLAAATYYYVVTATNAAGEALKSNEVSIVTTGATSTTTLTWSAVTGATGYKIYRGTAAAGENVYYAVGAVTSYTDTGSASTAGTPPVTNTSALASPVQSAASTNTGGTLAASTYYYVISATSGTGETLKSNEISITTTGSTSSNTLSWGAVAGATGYRIYRGTAAGGESVYYAVGNVTSYIDTNAASTAGTPATSNTTGAGNTGDTIDIQITEPTASGINKVVDLGTYTKSATDTSSTIFAASIAAFINSGTNTHGYSATSALGVVTINARASLGLALNTGTPIAAIIVGAISVTISQFTGGIGSKNAVMRYHINEYFRIQPKGVLYVGIFPIPGTYTFSEITTIQNFSNGTIRQIGVYKDSSIFATGDIVAINGVCASLDASHKNISALYAADMTGITLASLTDLSLLSSNKVSAIISQDGGGLGAMLALAYGKSVTTLGAALGAVAYAKVSDDIAWIQKFNISNGTECDTLAFANGVKYTDISITDSLLSNLNALRYIFLRKFAIAGSYFNDSHTATLQSSDYAYIENNRTIDKAIRGIYSDVLPLLNSPIQLKSDGTLTDLSIAIFTSAAGVSLAQMERDRELSASAIVIDSTQNVLSTSKITIAVKLIQIGVARNIVVNIGFALSI